MTLNLMAHILDEGGYGQKSQMTIILPPVGRQEDLIAESLFFSHYPISRYGKVKLIPNLIIPFLFAVHSPEGIML